MLGALFPAMSAEEPGEIIDMAKRCKVCKVKKVKKETKTL
jgi:hypothetical protein